MRWQHSRQLPEALALFSNYRMIEFAVRMSGELKLQHGETRWLYKKGVEPLTGTRLAYRREQMFTVPVGELLCSEGRTTAGTDW
jgi:asparagine synthase (glutamine-hydrolysing)